MNFITSDIKKLYKKYLFASLAGALVMSIYSFVDTIAVGQSEGPIGAAAMAVITPLYGTLVFLAIICGIGGSVLLSNAKGEGNKEKGNAYFTASVIQMGILTLAFWAAFILFQKEIFFFFGADESLLPKVMEYAKWLIRFFPVFIAPTFIGAFIRNDGAPHLAMAAVVTGGLVNVFGDWFFCFPLGMGMEGAAIATVLGTSLQTFLMCIHFFSRKCELKFEKNVQMRRMFAEILAIGFGSGILELGNVVLTVIFNHQIRKYGGQDALSVYGVIATVTALFQALFGGVGQALQPIVSANHGAGEEKRVRSVFSMALCTNLLLGTGFTMLGECFPQQITRLLMAATPEVLTLVSKMMRVYFLLFLPLGINVLSIYYLQSVMKGRASFLIAVGRSMVFSSLLLWTLPLMFGLDGVMLALPISEAMMAVTAICYIKQRVRR